MSEAAWSAAKSVKYKGYDGLLAWRSIGVLDGVGQAPVPPMLAALEAACRELLRDGAEVAFERHLEVARYAHERLRGLGLELVPRRLADCSPTVTSARLPAQFDAESLRLALSERDVEVGLGTTDGGAVLQLAHIGTHAELALVKRALDALAECVVEASPLS
jgi:aspartate aminotransferase-like enzyme